ncbi:hypothetical protein WME76_02065 [Sorangium sp. So ce119]|uniref:hypothetical protein n=1 Tax=Sorangium sp. So ce119 TaxID=3133279 RepID=UPI003F5F7950
MIEKVVAEWDNEKDRLEWLEKDARTRAKLKLRGYFIRALELPVGEWAELDSFVDDVVDAAIAGALRQRLEEGR